MVLLKIVAVSAFSSNMPSVELTIKLNAMVVEYEDATYIPYRQFWMVEFVISLSLLPRETYMP